MKAKKGLSIKQIEDEYILMDLGEVEPKFNGMIKLNETSKTIVSLLMEKDYTFDDLIANLHTIYKVDDNVLRESVTELINQLKSIKLINE